MPSENGISIVTIAAGVVGNNSSSSSSGVTSAHSSSSSSSSSRPKCDESSIDSDMAEKIKILTKKKQKKTAAPLPPPAAPISHTVGQPASSISPCSSNSPNSNSSHEVINYSSDQNVTSSDVSNSRVAGTSPTAKKLFLSMSDSSSSPTTYPSPSLSDASSSAGSSSNREHTDAQDGLHVTKISNSLVMPVLKTQHREVEIDDVDEEEEKRNEESIQSEHELSKDESHFYKYRNGKIYEIFFLLLFFKYFY